MRDRDIIEHLFRRGSLPILVSTTTLALGVNLPAHLVCPEFVLVIKVKYLINSYLIP